MSDTDSKTRALDTIGQSATHDSARGHVTGTAVYVDDMQTPAELVHVAPGYIDAAHATIESIDLSKVRASADVISVLEARDIPGVNDCSPAGTMDDPVLSDAHIEFHGQVVFAVVARTRDAARRAAQCAVVHFTTQPALVEIKHAAAVDNDIMPPYGFKRGNTDDVFTKASTSLSSHIVIGGQDHFYLEGQVALAIPGEDGTMTVHCSTQHPGEVQQTIAHLLGLPLAKVVCECRRMGGGFGGKESQAAQWACLAALAAVKTGRPASMRLDRDDDMIMTGKRHDFRVDYQCAYSTDGLVNAVHVDFASRCGNSHDLSLGVNDRTVFHADNAYYYPTLQINSRRYQTHTVSNTAFRGFGGPQGVLFAEHMMQSIAIAEGLDALDVRKRNLYGEQRDLTPYDMPVEYATGHDIINQLEHRCDYRQRRHEIDTFNSASSILKKGLALTPVKFGIAFTLKHLNQAGALLNVYTDGSAQINHGGTEMGQGLYTKVSQVVAETLGVSLDKVEVSATRTDKVPNTTATAASSGADLNGMAAQRAAITIRDRLAALAAERWQVAQASIQFVNNDVKSGTHRMTFAALCECAFTERVSLSATGYYATPGITWDRETATGRPFLYFAWGAGCSEVTIDTLTGEMRVDRVDVIHDCGHSLNPAIDKGQIEGAFVQGMGWLTTEELVFDDQGRLRTHAPSTYKIPTCADTPAVFNVDLYESSGNSAPTIYRSKAVGEPPLMLATSVYCAVMDALVIPGRRQVPELVAPTTPESIVNAVQALRG